MHIYREQLPADELCPAGEQQFPEDYLFFDIETTGLSSSRNQIYCIGCAWRQESVISIEILFADKKADEAEVLRYFSELLSRFSGILTFNGTTFDIPFLSKRGEHFRIPICFDNKESMDLFRDFKRLKDLLLLPNCKQKTFEQFLGCFREDQYNGGQLIEVYEKYCTSRDPDLYQMLLLHNLEDVKGMFQLLSLYSYKHFLQGEFTVTAIELSPEYNARIEQIARLHIELKLAAPVPQPVRKCSSAFFLYLSEDRGILQVPLQKSCLKYFFPDYRNYFYLPAEHTIVHKSIGAFVEPEHREKATKENCFLPKECYYIETNSQDKNCRLRKDAGDKTLRFDLTDHILQKADHTLCLKESPELTALVSEFAHQIKFCCKE